MVHPLVLRHSVQTNMAETGPKLKNQWGSNKIENVHAHGELQIQKKLFVPLPYHMIHLF